MNGVLIFIVAFLKASHVTKHGKSSGELEQQFEA